MARRKARGWDDIWWSCVKRGMPYEEAAYRAEMWSKENARKALAAGGVDNVANVSGGLDETLRHRQRQVRHGNDD